MPGAPDLSVRIGGLRLENPVMPASGTFGYGEEYAPFLDLNRLGAVVVKTLTLRPRLGSPPHRSTEVPSGMLASIGLQNVGVEAFVRDKLPFFEGLDTRLIASIGGETMEEYARVAGRLEREERVDALEVNLSCPNVTRGGMQFGRDPFVVEALVGRIRDRTRKPLIAKLAPMVSDIRAVAAAARRAGADGVSLINGPPGMAVDVRTRRSRLGNNRSGGLAGPAVRPLALHLVDQVVQEVDIPVVGIGGISSVEDALEFLIVGATAVQVGTWNFVNPRITADLVEGLEVFLREQGQDKVRTLIGSMR
jgi:dihydroorotate dehydrogenase (NAD+) catalytic subunit